MIFKSTLNNRTPTTYQCFLLPKSVKPTNANVHRAVVVTAASNRKRTTESVKSRAFQTCPKTQSEAFFDFLIIDFEQISRKRSPLRHDACPSHHGHEQEDSYQKTARQRASTQPMKSASLPCQRGQYHRLTVRALHNKMAVNMAHMLLN